MSSRTDPPDRWHQPELGSIATLKWRRVEPGCYCARAAATLRRRSKNSNLKMQNAKVKSKNQLLHTVTFAFCICSSELRDERDRFNVQQAIDRGA